MSVVEFFMYRLYQLLWKLKLEIDTIDVKMSAYVLNPKLFNYWMFIFASWVLNIMWNHLSYDLLDSISYWV